MVDNEPRLISPCPAFVGSHPGADLGASGAITDVRSSSGRHRVQSLRNGVHGLPEAGLAASGLSGSHQSGRDVPNPRRVLMLIAMLATRSRA
jgi:hypothetical protein